MLLDEDALGIELASRVRTYVERATSPLLLRIAALEQRATTPGPSGPQGDAGLAGERGEKGDAGSAGLRGEKGDIGPVGEAGPAGVDGKDADPVTEEQIAAAVRAYLEANPPAAGKDGLDGINGKDGTDGRNGVDGAAGQKGDPGLDGVGLAGALIDRDGVLIVTMTNGETRPLGPVVGKDGTDGLDGQAGEQGAPGFGLDDFDTEMKDEGRTLVLKFIRGDTLETHDLHLGHPLDRGVFKDGRTYAQGDGVTWGGSFWIAQRETAAKPETDDSWRLAVKRGRDGKDGNPGKDGAPGRDLRSKV